MIPPLNIFGNLPVFLPVFLNGQQYDANFDNAMYIKQLVT